MDQSMLLNTQPFPVGSRAAIAAAVAVVAKVTITLNLGEEQMGDLWQTSVAAFLDSMADIAFAQGCMQGHAARIKADHCDLVYRKTKDGSSTKVHRAYRWRWRTSASEGPLFTHWEQAEGFEALL